MSTGVADELAGGGAVAGGEEVAAAEFFGGEADDAGDLVHVALEWRRWLCGAPKPRKAPWGGMLVATALARTRRCGPVVGAGGVDGAAREDDGGEGGVGSAVDGEVDFAGEEFAVFARRRCGGGCGRGGAWWWRPCLRRGRSRS